MKRIIYLALLLCPVFCLAQKEQMDYTLSWEGTGMRVSAVITTASDTLRCAYGDDNAGGLRDQLKWFQELKTTQGQALVDSARHSFRLIPKDKQVRLSYVIRGTVVPEAQTNHRTCIRDMFAPDIDSKMLYIQGYNLFLNPEGSEQTACTVQWGRTPDFPVFCLYNPGKGTDTFSGTMDQVISSVIVGDPLLKVDPVMIDGHAQYLVTALRKHADLNRQVLKDYFHHFYQKIASFWKDPMDVPYSLVIFPFRYNHFECSGNGYYNGFLSRYDAQADTILNVARRDIYTHEIGHKWIGGGPEWYSEGFNEMQTGYQLVSAGLDKPEYFATYLNVALKGLYNNPHRAEPDSVAETHFWDDGQYVWLLYWRGYSYAFYLAGQIEKASGVKNAYAVLMHALEPDIQDMDEQKFVNDVSKVLDRKIVEESFRKYILEGKDIDYQEVALPSGCEIYYLPTGEPQLRVTDSKAFAEHFLE